MNQPTETGERIRLQDVVTMGQVIKDCSNQSEKPATRIVSKAEYAGIQSRRAVIGIQNICWFGAAVVCGFITFLLVLIGTLGAVDGSPSTLFTCLFGAIFMGMVTCMVSHLAHAFADENLTKVDDVTFTRANPADIPARDSLVRASAEPVQEQTSILLRAATESVQRQEEQLVRAAVGVE